MTTTERYLSLLRRQTPTQPGRVRITLCRGNKEDAVEYDFASEPHDGGWHYRLVKPDGTAYDIVLTALEQTCDCFGCLRHGECKHLAAARVLAAREGKTVPDLVLTGGEA